MTERIFYSSLEDKLERQSKRVKVEKPQEHGIDLEALGVDGEEPDLSLYSETAQRAYEAQQNILDEFERKKRARNLAVPTDDARVKQRLREFGEPICLFAEGVRKFQKQLNSVRIARRKTRTFTLYHVVEIDPV